MEDGEHDHRQDREEVLSKVLEAPGAVQSVRQVLQQVTVRRSRSQTRSRAAHVVSQASPGRVVALEIARSSVWLGKILESD